MAESWQHVVIAVVTLLIMAIAALAQSAIGLTSAQRLRSATGDRPSGQRSVQSMADPRRALSTSMLLLQVLMAVIATGQLSHIIDRSTDRDLSWVAIGIVALVYLIFGQGLPRALAEKQLDRFFHGVLAVAHVVTMLLMPVTWFVERTASVLLRVLPGERVEPEAFGLEEELRPLRHDSDDEVINADERVMIDGILSLEEMSVRDIMVPRLDIVAVDRSVNPRELIDIIVKAGHSRIPVYQESVDRILGVLYAKDLLPFVIGNTARIPLLDLIRPAFVVPESKRLNVLFAELRRTKIHLAIVADEYGGTAGLVTIEDILEEIVGEIQDEFDTEDWLFEVKSENQLLADGRLPIEDVEDALRIRFEEDDDFGTLGGFVHKHLGRLPLEGDAFEAEGVRVEILAVERHRVRKLLITKLPPEEPDNDRQEGRRERFRRIDPEDPVAGVDVRDETAEQQDSVRSGTT
ncbi:MAG: Magnesium and cobalt efflux protein CorC [uncultured Thermomicrobiales bacterium]|uniref:Magnesium and cobalt efflux protein CorC n=1 Tax=uncultured Thermomicrobiales bacterium TaxID=1645740 RepID=A0A6J4UJG6_9BACT|nr:MAG: Magnesium and cobalt efflux protein CorC [uncultured Thermomicrobiales bacterium]